MRLFSKLICKLCDPYCFFSIIKQIPWRQRSCQRRENNFENEMNNEEISVLIRPASRTGAPEFSLPIHFLYYRLPYRLARPVLERWPYFQSIGGFMQSRETQTTMVTWTNAGGQTKRANERSFVYRPPAWRRWRNVKTTYTVTTEQLNDEYEFYRLVTCMWKTTGNQMKAYFSQTDRAGFLKTLFLKKSLFMQFSTEHCLLLI